MFVDIISYYPIWKQDHPRDVHLEQEVYFLNVKEIYIKDTYEVNVYTNPSVAYNLSKKANQIVNHHVNYPILFAFNVVSIRFIVNSIPVAGNAANVNLEVHISVYVVVNHLHPIVNDITF